MKTGMDGTDASVRLKRESEKEGGLSDAKEDERARAENESVRVERRRPQGGEASLFGASSPLAR